MRSALLVLVCVVIGCGGDDTASVSGAPTCGDGELVVEGTLDGTLANDSRTGYTTFSFVNAVGDANGRFNIGFPSGDSVFLEFPDFTNKNKIADARGFIDFRDGGGVFGGFCETMSEFSSELLIPKDGGQYEFLIKRLRVMEPFCTAEIVPGEIVGCFRPRVTVDAGP